LCGEDVAADVGVGPLAEVDALPRNEPLPGDLMSQVNRIVLSLMSATALGSAAEFTLTAKTKAFTKRLFSIVEPGGVTRTPGRD
jgi:hypothetical protein